MDEINAHLAEQTLSNKNILERLVADDKKPTLKEKILNFFKGAKTDYKDDVKLSKAAEKLYKQYKKLFDEFSARNYQKTPLKKRTRLLWITTAQCTKSKSSGRKTAKRREKRRRTNKIMNV